MKKFTAKFAAFSLIIGIIGMGLFQNFVSVPIAKAATAPVFKDATCTSTITSLTAGNTFCIEVTDTKLDISSAADAVVVTVTNGLGDSEAVVLEETGATTEVFQGTLATVSGVCNATTNDSQIEVNGTTILWHL